MDSIKPTGGPRAGEKFENGCPQFTPASAIYQVITIFFNPGEVCEIRALGLCGNGPWEGWGKGTVNGYFDDPVKLAAAAKKLDDLKRATGIYFCMNPVNPALLARANNRLIVPKNTTTDEQIICQRWLLIDTDPKRPPGISATNAELATAITYRDAIADYLHEHGLPDPIRAYSGNGGHLLYKLLDLPNTPEIAEFKKQALKALKHKFDSDEVNIDQTVANASRITKLYGTLARKGDSMSDRPHRISYLEVIPEPTVPVTLEQLEWLASLAPEEKANSYAQKKQAGGNSAGKEKYASKVLESCCEKIRQSQEGDQHHIRRDAAQLIGGYLQYIDEGKVMATLEQAVRDSGVKDMRASMKTVRDGIAYGKLEPIAIPDIHGSSAAHSGPVQPGQEQAKPEPLSYSVIDISDFLAKELPPRENILAPWLPRQGLAMIHSKRGIGKTFMALNIAYAVACGGKFLSWGAPQPAGVFFIDGEMPANVIQKRLASIIGSNELEPKKPLFIMTPDLQSQGMPDLGTIAGQEAVNKHLTDEIELIIVDNISTLSRYGKENDAASWLPLQEWSLKLRAQGKAVLFIHHSGKGGFQRGTSRREDILDSVLCLRHTQDYEPTQGACFEIHFEKSRGIYGADVEPFEARLENGVWTMKSIKHSAYEKTVKLTKDGYSQKEIADEIGKTKGYISKLVRQAKEKGDLP